MRRVVILIMVAIAGLAGACSDSSKLTVTASPAAPTTTLPAASLPTASISTATPTTSGIDAIRAQITRASNEVCTLVSAQNVALSFAEAVPLTTQPMGEASGPACGYPHPRAGGYLLVIQFQELAWWGGYAKSGTRIEGLGHEAVLSARRTELFVLDVERGTVIMLLAADSPVGGVDALLHVAAVVYDKAPETVRVAG